MSEKICECSPPLQLVSGVCQICKGEWRYPEEKGGWPNIESLPDPMDGIGRLFNEPHHKGQTFADLADQHDGFDLVMSPEIRAELKATEPPTLQEWLDLNGLFMLPETVKDLQRYFDILKDRVKEASSNIEVKVEADPNDPTVMKFDVKYPFPPPHLPPHLVELDNLQNWCKQFPVFMVGPNATTQLREASQSSLANDLQKLIDGGDHACQTGDCGHDKQSECDEVLAAGIVVPKLPRL